MATPSLGFDNFYTSTLSAGITASDTTIYLNALPTATEGYLVIEPDSSTQREIIYYTSKGANFVTLPSAAAGRGVGATTAQSHSSGVTAQMNVVAEHFEALQDGTGIAASAITSTKIANYSDIMANFVVSGGIWSGDAYASTRAASMTAAVCYIAGIRTTVSLVTARTFTASKDTYVDILSNGAGTGTLVYTEVTNNAASPALAANSIRLAIVVTGATNIAAVGSINQGQPNKVLPIASNIPYTYTDSLGNIICSRTPNPVVIAYRESVANTTSSTSITAVFGLSCPIIVPSGRNIKVTFWVARLANATQPNNGSEISIWEGTVGSGTRLSSANFDGLTINNAGFGIITEALCTPSTSSVTINAGLIATTGGTATLLFKANSPIYGWLKVELA